MEHIKIKLAVELTITSEKPLTEDEKAYIVDDADYNFSFTENLNGNLVMITETEIIDILEE